MGTDARVRYTKRIIKEKFVALLKDRPLNKITVKDICALAEINRATFYKYYHDPYDLLAKIEEDCLSELTSHIGQTRALSFRDFFLLILKKLRDDAALYQTLFSGHGDSQFPIRLFSICYTEQAASLHCQFPNLSIQERELLYYFLAHGCSGILTQWISGGMREPVSCVADFAQRLIENATHGL